MAISPVHHGRHGYAAGTGNRLRRHEAADQKENSVNSARNFTASAPRIPRFAPQQPRKPMIYIRFFKP
ncbi:hypothetical protein K788_0002524 [Paraburkholderia caribensis MBA4]|uniref:Uncharacterized protein n=1 Tax=Paraburkholderia caribensis MBA4 TaxID=1323664 RepID=A0A0P0RA51_9BURK|nr:hypothetical protein K788_0002524 [Paraburkholderia caribensis MBA4]